MGLSPGMMARLLGFALSRRNGLWIGLALFLALVAASWIGFAGSDDVTYAWGAYGWLEEFPYVGGHGTIRYLITIPMAISFLLLGEHEVAMVLPSLLYTLGFLIICWWAVRRVAGQASAWAALLALVTSPLLVIQASLAGVDVVETFYLFASVLLFWRCLEDGPDRNRLLLSGAMAGCAFLTRETAIFIAVFFAILFAIGHRFHRGHYLWIAAGFLGVWALELLYLGIMTGDPLYRFNISLNHDSTIDRSVDLAGNVIVNPLLDPLMVLLVNQEFMALFLFAVPLGLWLCFGRSVDAPIRHFARILSLFGLVWFACVSAAQTLLPLNPRYFMITAAVACVLTGMGLARLLLFGSRKARLAAGLGALALLGGNMLGIYVENKDSLFGERTLASLSRRYPEAQITTDPMTRYRADMLLRWEGARARVGQTPPIPGGLYFHNPARADTANFKMPEGIRPLYQPRQGWEVLSQFEPDAPYAAQLIEATGLSSKLPQGIWHKLRYRHPVVTLYRVRGGSRAQPAS